MPSPPMAAQIYECACPLLLSSNWLFSRFWLRFVGIAVRNGCSIIVSIMKNQSVEYWYYHQLTEAWLDFRDVFSRDTLASMFTNQTTHLACNNTALQDAVIYAPPLTRWKTAKFCIKSAKLFLKFNQNSGYFNKDHCIFLANNCLEPDGGCCASQH